MAKLKSHSQKAIEGQQAVDQFLASLDHPLLAEINALRALIQAIDPSICESIKWNAPSFYLADHFATFKLRPQSSVQIVLHTGAKAKVPQAKFQIDDPSGLLTWAAPDRCLLSFANLNQVEAQSQAVTAILRQWIAQL